MAAENKRIKTGLRPETEENAPATVPQNQAVARYPSALVFGAVAAGSLAWHFVAAESDTGGTFFQIWISVVALIGLTKADSTPSRFPILIWTVVLPMVCSLTIATLYFAVQAIIPLALLTALLGALWYFSQDRKKMAFLLLLLLPMVFYVRYGIRHMQTVYQIRHLDAAQVNRIEFSPLSRTEGKSRAIQLAAQDELKKIVAALAATVPYSPNHESLKNPWRVTITLRSGENLVFTLGCGNRNNPQTAWVQFGVEVYQNPELYKIIVTDLKLPLWQERE